MSYLKVTSTPSGATLKISDYEETTPTTWIFIDDWIKNGKIKFSLSKSGYKTQKYNIKIGGKRKTEYNALLEKITTPTPIPTPTPTETEEQKQEKKIISVYDQIKNAVDKKDNKTAFKLAWNYINDPFGGKVVGDAIPIGFSPITWASILKNWKAILGVITGIASTTTFVSFLYEEALQTQGMGVWVLVSNKDWNNAQKQLDKARGTLKIANWLYTYLGWLNPLTWKVFKDYAKATEDQYSAYQKTISAKTGSYENPSENGKVFDTEGFEESIDEGEAPKESELVTKEKEIVVVPIATDLQSFWNEVKSYYVGRAYLSKKELLPLAKKYGLDTSGL